jgi:signal transduction histidine kinase/ligand-binding sensor domain-containing protein/DNA-binding response OmpR family regulator
MSSRAAALDPERAPTQYVQAAWTTVDGLPHNAIRAIAQTRDGYLWLATHAGLARFDGVRFEVFDTQNSALRHNEVRALCEDADGTLWIGTAAGGLHRLRDGTIEPFDALGDLTVERLVSTGGALYAATPSGLQRIAASGVSALGLPGGPSVRIVSLAAARQGGLWVGTNVGLALYRDGWREPGLPPVSERIQAVLEDARGRVFAGTPRELLVLERDRIERVPVRSEDGVFALLADRDGSLWAGLYGGGLLRLASGRSETFTPAQGFLDRRAWALAEDREGNLWIGTRAGLAQLRDGPATTMSKVEGLASDVIRAVFEDADGSVWIGGLEGLSHVTGRSVVNFNTAAGLAHDNVRAVGRDREGRLWAATQGGFSVRQPDGRFRSYFERDGLPGNILNTAFVDRRGRVWLGSSAGLAVREGDRLASLAGLAGENVHSVFEDAAGTIWIGTLGTGRAGLWSFDGAAFTPHTLLPGALIGVRSFHQDGEGRLYIGTLGAGIFVKEKQGLLRVTSREGLPDDSVWSMLPDESGHLWMSSDRGIFRVSRTELLAVARGERPRLPAGVVLGQSDGMKTIECNGGGWPAGIWTRRGRLMFPTARGVVTVDPQRALARPPAPPALVERVLADNAPLQQGRPSRVPAGTRDVEVRFAGLSFVDAPAMEFQYRLEPREPEWIDSGTRRYALYSELPPGSYRFLVRARHARGAWGEASAAWPVEVAPRWHQRVEVRLAALGTLLLATAVLFRARTRALRERGAELEALVARRTAELRHALSEAQRAREEAEDRGREAESQRTRAEEANRAKSVFLATMSHELRTPLNVVLGFAQVMDRSGRRSPEDRQHLARIRRSGEHLLTLIDDVLSFSKIESGRVTLAKVPFAPGELVRDVEEMLGQRAEAKGLDFRVESEELPPFVLGDAGRLRQILINLLANALKFTERGSVTLRVRWASDRGVFEVEDTGPGIAEEELEALFQTFSQTEAGRRSPEGAGLGLALSRELARAMGGDIVVDSALWRGARFRLEVALPAVAEGRPRKGEDDARRVRCLAPGQREWRVLVVDDVPDNRVLLSNLLASVGFAVREAKSGEEAIEVWRSWRPHLVWLDKRMPGIGGLAAVRRIREEESQSGRERATIIALSASAMEHERQEALASGCDDFVSKPVRESALFERTAAPLGATYLYEEERAAERRRPVLARRFAPGQAVLVVDDQSPNREVAKALLGHLGLGFAEAGDGREALRLLREAEFDAVLLDIEMPGLDGIETLRRVRSSEGRSRIPIVALTAHASAEDERLFVSLGADAHLAKPVDADRLAETLARFLRVAEQDSGDETAGSLPGIDMEAGLQQVAGDAALHRRLVQSLAGELAGFLDRLSAALDAGHGDQAARLIHGVRGSAAALGARRLAAAAADVETLLRREPGVRPSLAELAAAIAEIRASPEDR